MNFDKQIPRILSILAASALVTSCSMARGSNNLSQPTTTGAGGAQNVMQANAAAAPPPEMAAAAGGDPNVYVGLAKRVIPSVVNISTLTMVKAAPAGSPEEMLRQFFQGQGQGGWGFQMTPQNQPRRARPMLKSAALGSGFVIDESGIILTNNHVVADADEIKISFTEDRKEKPTEGKVIGRDPDLDVALIRVKTDRKLVPLALGDSDKLPIGEYVAAVGNPFGQGHSISHGIISQEGRYAPELPLATYLQTDAPINPGNSGGPLVNLKGEVIGINDAIDPRAHGIGFAIPINVVKRELDQLETHGKIARGYLGVLIDDLNPDLAEKIGVGKSVDAPVVTHVEASSPAKEAGIKAYDVITAINGKPVHSAAEMMAAVASLPAGDRVAVQVNRDGREKSIDVKLGKRPSPQELSRAEQTQPWGMPPQGDDDSGN